MAQFNADIVFNADVSKVDRQIRALERRLERLRSTAEEVKVGGSQKLLPAAELTKFEKLSNSIDASARRATKALKGLAAAGGAFAGADAINSLGQALEKASVSFSVFSKNVDVPLASLNQLGANLREATGFIEPFVQGLQSLGAGGVTTAAGIGLATTAFVAFEPALKTALGKLQVAEKLFNNFAPTLKETTVSFDGYIQRIRKATDTVSKLQESQRIIRNELDRTNSSTEEAADTAGAYVRVTARLNDELREQADLIRRARGVNVTELEASRGRKSIDTRREQERFETTNKREFAQVDASIERLIQKEAELENARLDARAEKEAERAEKSLRASRNDSIQTLERQIAIEERIQNVRSQRIARAASSDAQARQASQVRTEIQGQVNSMRLLAKTGTDVVFNTRLQYQLAQQVSTAMDGVVQDYEKQIAAQKRLNNFLQEGAKIRQSYAQENTQRKAKRGQFAENLALGAGFPLLFGAGAGSVAGSIAGSFVGTGFGGQILGGAVGQILDDFSSKLKDVATSLSKPKEALEALEEAGLKVDDSIRQQVDSLLEAGKSYEAQQLVLQQITETLGPDAVSQLAAYDQETKKLEKSYQQAYSALVRELLPAMVGFVGLLNAVAGAFGNMPDWVKNIITGASYSGPFGISRVQFDALQNAGRDRSEGVQPTAPEQSPEFQKRQKELQQAAKQREIALRGQSEELQAQLDLLNSGLDITTDKGFELAKQVVIVKYLAELEEINNSKLEDGEKILKRQVALLQQKIGIANLESQRNRALQSAQSRAASAAASAAREAEARQKQVYAARISEINVLKDRFDYSVRNTQFEKGELAALEQRGKQLALERDGQLEILDIKYKQSAANAKSAEEATILYSVYRDQYQLLIDQYNLENKLNEQRKRALQTELAITALQRKQQAINTRRELEQERDRLALPTGNFIADAFNQQKLEQAFRYENTLRNINDQITELEERQKGADVDLFNTLGEQIKGLKEQRSIFQTLIPEIAAAEKQQLAYNQALGLIQGPVSSLVGGLREVAAGTKSVEQAFADFLNGLAEQLAQTAAQMIAQYIAIGIARKFAGLDSGFNFAGGSADAGASAANLLGGFGPIPRFANGGNPPVNKPSIVGERGPELFVPGTRGTIIPNDAMGGEVNSVVNINISDSGTSVDAKNAGKLGRMIESSTMAILTRERRPGGLLTR